MYNLKNFKMPFAKKAKYTPKKKVRKYRPSALTLGLNKGLVHHHVSSLSTSTTGPLTILNPTSGVAVFQYASTQSANMQLSFRLDGMSLFLGGVFVALFPLPNVAEYQALYDSYMIEKIEVSVWSSGTVAQVGNVKQAANPTGSTAEPIGYATQPLPLIGYTVDMDDFENTTFTQLQQYSTFKCKQLGGGEPIRCSFTPTCRDTLSTDAGFGRSARQVINTANAAVNHFGLKMAVDGFKCTNLSENSLCTFLSVQAKYSLRMIATR